MRAHIDKKKVQAFIDWFEKNEHEIFMHYLEWLVLNSHLALYMAASPITGMSPISLSVYKAIDRFLLEGDETNSHDLYMEAQKLLWSDGYVTRNLEFRPGK